MNLITETSDLKPSKEVTHIVNWDASWDYKGYIYSPYIPCEVITKNRFKELKTDLEKELEKFDY